MKRILLSALMMATIGTAATAQWTRTNGPEGASFTDIAADDSIVVGAMPTGGILRRDAGRWEETSAPPLHDLLLADRKLFGRGQFGQYLSRDYGMHWTMVDAPGIVLNIGGLPFMIVNDSLYGWKDDQDGWSLAGKLPGAAKPTAYKSSLYTLAGESRDTLTRSPDRGVTWMTIPSDIASHGTAGRFIVSGPDGLYMGWNTNDLYRSTDDGATWQSFNEGIGTSSRIAWIVSNPTTVWAGDQRTIHRLHDGHWEAFPLPFSADAPIAVEDGLIVSGASGPVMIGNDAPAPVSLSSGLRKLDIMALGAIGSVVTASAWDATYRSTDAGDHWTKSASIGMTGFASSGGAMMAIASEAYMSADSGATWEPLTSKLAGSTNMQCLLATPRAVYMGHGDLIFDSTTSWIDGGIYRSTDQGLTWAAANTGLPVHDNQTVPVTSLAANADTIVALTAKGIHTSRNAGDTWFEATMGLPATMDYASGGMLLGMGGSIYLFTFDGIFRTDNNGELWTPMSAGIPPGLMLASYPVVVDDRIYMQVFEMLGDGSEKVYTYTFDGTSWEDASASMPPGIFFNAYARTGNTLFAGSRGNSVWRQVTPLSVPGDRATGQGIAAVHPNPVNGEATLGLTLAGRALVRVTIVDARGEVIRVVFDGTLEAGANAIPMTTDALHSGAYFVRIAHDGMVTTAPFVKR